MRNPGPLPIAVLALAVLATPVLAQDDQPDPTPRFSDEQLEFFQREVEPILRENCFKCHGGGEKVRGEFRLTSRGGILKGGELGPAVDLDDPDASLLIEAIQYAGLEMPPTGKLPADKIDVLTRWVKMGLPWTPGASGAAHTAPASPQVDDKTRNFWSYRPVARPALPAESSEAWVRTPIDAFILRGLEAAQLSPNPPAEKAALIRRASYDLIGLPPTPDEVAAFVADTSDNAFEKVIDRLLESPSYGEHWARHWLDLVRYAETNSYERDGNKEYIWRYRDYVIRSLNDDKPYDQFIVEQLAGDELEPRTAEQLIATGYYRLGIWQDEPVDPKQALYDDLDDILGTTSQVFLGMTINCCRCHDHKLDPIPQRDYYRMLAFFNGVTRLGVRSNESVAKNSLRPIATEADMTGQSDEVTAHEARVREVEEAIAAIEETVMADFVPVEHEDFKHERNRLALVKKRVPRLITQPQFEQYRSWVRQRRQLARMRPQSMDMALCVTEVGTTPRPTHVLIRGSARAEGEPVEPGFPSVLGFEDPVIPLPDSDAASSGRRSVLARWIASPANPLTARVMVNRVWQYHFGRGIVRSTNNFGLQGTPPTHPELLDWLADELVAGEWKLKRIHKMLMLSSTYQLASEASPGSLSKDPENNLFWRYDMRRLTAEEIRDSILAVNGSLNPEMYGPSFYPIIPQEVKNGLSRPDQGWGVSTPEDLDRRTVYSFIKRSLITPILASFDAADPDASCPIRFATTQPTQALGMMNSELIERESAVFAEYLRQHADSVEAQVRLAISRATQRPPTTAEIERGIQLIKSLEQQHGLSAARALEYYCVLVFNLNEFIYLD